MAANSRVRHSPFALRITQRKDGAAAVVYQRRADPEGRDRLQRVASLGPLAYGAALPLLRAAVAASAAQSADAPPQANGLRLTPGPFYPLDAAWGARVACYALVASGLTNGERLIRAAQHLRVADADQAAWWLGLLTHNGSTRALRALRILTEAVE